MEPRPGVEHKLHGGQGPSGGEHGDNDRQSEGNAPARLNRPMQLPQTCDPDTYDPDEPMPGTPEPENSDPETYAAWGAKRFGKEWYDLRKSMLAEVPGNLEYKVYKDLQRDLRAMEHKAEGRPLRPCNRDGSDDLSDEGWKRVWARLSRDTKPVEASSTPVSEHSDSDTSPPTPEPREPIPESDDLRNLLEYMRKQQGWDEERYQFWKFYLKDEHIDEARNRREDEVFCNGEYYMTNFRLEAYREFTIGEHHYYIGLLEKGWTYEQIVAKYEADVGWHEWGQENPAPRASILGHCMGPEEWAEMDVWREKYDVAFRHFFAAPRGTLLPYWVTDYGGMYNIRDKGILGRVTRRRQREALLSDTTGDASSRTKELQRIEDEERLYAEELARAIDKSMEMDAHVHINRSSNMSCWFDTWDEWGICLESQNKWAAMWGHDGRAGPSEAPRQAKETKGELDDKVREEEEEAAAAAAAAAVAAAAQHRGGRRRTVYKKERSSRRLAGQRPEYGVLGEGEPGHPARPAASGMGARGGQRAKRPAAARVVKHQKTSKPKPGRRTR